MRFRSMQKRPGCDNTSSSGSRRRRHRQQQLFRRCSYGLLLCVVVLIAGTVLFLATTQRFVDMLGLTQSSSISSQWEGNTINTIRGKEETLDHPPTALVAASAQEKRRKVSVVVVGAGAAGLTAAHTLRKQSNNVRDDNNNGAGGGGDDRDFPPFFDVKILEASQVFGGRIRKDTTLADYPVDLGASFVFNPSKSLKIIKGDDDVGDIRTFNLSAQQSRTMYRFYDDDNEGGTRPKRREDISNSTESDNSVLFVNYSWYDFFADHIVPTGATSGSGKEEDSIFEYGCQVNVVDYTTTNNAADDEKNGGVRVACRDGRAFVVDYVVVTVPLSVLKDGDIDFRPDLPDSIVANHRAEMWNGFKILFEFAEKFYADYFEWAVNDGECHFWDYSAAQTKTSKQILSGYIMGDAAVPFENLDESEIVKKVLEKLDGAFDGQATVNYVNHVLVNWQKEPFIRGTYSNIYPRVPNGSKGGPRIVGDGRIFIAGEAFPIPFKQNAWVHSAAFSGKKAALEIIKYTQQKR